jgi:cytochrome c553
MRLTSLRPSLRIVIGLSGWISAVISIPADAADPAAATPSNAESEAFFESRVRPILVDKCLSCHGDKQQKGDLRLDSRDAALKGNDNGPAVVPGKPDESRLVAVISHREDIKMPPKQRLSDTEIAALTQWVRLGAPWSASATKATVAPINPTSPEGITRARATHWSLQPVRKPDVPAVQNAAWCLTDIDRFVLAKLEAAGIAPSPPTDRRRWLRRVTFDLIGLPPKADEVTAFEADQSPDAFEKVVDRLLASSRYGERWGRHWLDVARYADTKGYVFTEERRYPFSYTYRDYVIRAFNRDLPFDRFILEQLAADQLELGDDKWPLAGLGYLTLGRRFGNNINDIIDDRIDVVSRGLLGLTVTCARCHDHKYDPIPTEDYYSLYGVFASSIEPAELPLIAPPVESEAYFVFEKERKVREAEVNKFIDQQHAAVLDELRSRVGVYLAEVAKPKASGDVLKDLGRRLNPGELRPQVVTRWRDFLNGTSKQHHPVFAPWHDFAKLMSDGDVWVAEAARIVASLTDAAESPTRVNSLVKQALGKLPPKSMADVARVYGELLVSVDQEWHKLLAAEGQTKSFPDEAKEQLRQVLYSDATPSMVSRDDVQKQLPRDKRDKLRELQKKVEQHKVASPDAPPRAMVLNDAANPIEVHVFIRGQQGRQGPLVPRRFLQVLSKPDEKPFQRGSGRLELAQAIASPSNPLTARVLVNRVWKQHFEVGLVTTPSDFGARGDVPEQRELLDHLAATFMEDGWSIKRLHRRLLLSAVYRQRSDDRAEAAKVDPENRLWWRMNRLRLEWEPLRDSLLAASGRLDTTEGGRPIDLMKTPFSTRRTVYGFIDRQDLPGLFRVFDIASPDVSTGLRAQTTVPQQALFEMNSPFVIEQARHLASRPEINLASQPSEKIAALYRLIFARPTQPDELSLGQQYLTAATPPIEQTVNGWRYGYGEFDGNAKRVTSFTPLPHFQDGRWSGGTILPDPALGWVFLNAGGGHPGDNPRHAAIRRWTASVSGDVRVSGALKHDSLQGDGVRGRIVSSRHGELGTWSTHNRTAETTIERVAIQPGETLDFLVDCVGNTSFDGFGWSPQIELVNGSPDSRRTWHATRDFSGPDATSLSALEQYVQALLMSNEFVFVD